MAVPDTAQLIAKIYTDLNADGTLTALLGTYNPGGGAVASIFSGHRVPSQAGAPFVHIRPVFGRTPFDTVDKRGVLFTLDIACYSDNLESIIELDSIVDRVVELLHRQKLTLSTDEMISATCTGLVRAETDDNLVGAILSFEFLIMET